MRDDYRRPHFNFPPVTRAIISVAHEPLGNLRGAHIGAFWASLNSAGDYPHVIEFEATGAHLERFDGSPSPDVDLDVEYGDLVDVPRVVLATQDDTRQIAVEVDKLEVSWHRGSAAAGRAYPRFEMVYEHFVTVFSKWREFLLQAGLGELRVVQAGFTYLNTLPRGEGWNSAEDLAQLFRVPVLREREGELERIYYADHTVVVDSTGSKKRVHVSFGADTLDADAAASLRIICQGPVPAADEAVLAAIDAAHEIAVRTFLSVTTPEAHALWDRISP